MGRRILVTGGQGFVGRALVRQFAEQGHRVICADLTDTPYLAGVMFIRLDIRAAADVLAACKGVDSIVHNASMVHTAQNRIKDVWDVNLKGTENILAACKAHAIPRLVYISSASAVYEGRDIENGDETLPYSSISQAPYADSKIAAEKAVLAMDGSVTQTCAIRPHVIFGADDRRLIPALVEKARQGKLRRAIGKRDKLSDFTYITNLTDAVVVAEEKLVAGSPVCGQAYFITNGEPMAFFDFIERFIVKLGHPPIKGEVPFWLVYSVAAVAELWDTVRGGEKKAENGLTRFAVNYMVTHHYFSIKKAQRDLGWTPKVSIEEGLNLTVAGLRA